MSTLADLRPGDIGFGPLAGVGNPLVAAGQMILGEGFTVGKLNIGHVFVVGSTDKRVVEAMPKGARETIIGAERWTPEYAYVRLPEDYPGQAADAAAVARAMIGTPYSFASYAALALWHFGRKPPTAEGPGMRKLEAWIDRRRPEIEIPSVNQVARPMGSTMYVALPAEAICSVLADQAWALTGKQVMPAGTPHQCVTPGALARALLEMPGAQWFWPQ